MVEIGQFVRVDLSCIIVIHLVSCIVQRFVCFLCIFVYFTITDALKTARFFKSERNPPIPAKISKYFISTNHLLSDFSNKKTVKLFSKLDRHIDIFIPSSSVCSLSSLTIWKSSTSGITPSVLPLSKIQCKVPISSICSIFFCCVGFDFLFGENWRKASTVLYLKFLPSKRKKARKCELFGHNIYFIAQVWCG